MVKKFFIFAFAAVLIGATGWLIYQRQLSNAGKTAASIGIALGSVSPTPTSATGDIAMQDVKNIIGSPAPANWCTNPGPVRTLEGGMKVLDCAIGTGEEAKAGMAVKVQYTGTLEGGTKFDSSYDRGTPFQFTLGTGMVIKGWDVGIAGMRVGGKRQLAVPPSMGYGAKGSGTVIPPNTALYFDVELLAVGSAGNSR
jgi:hypothetical protein